MDVYHLPKEMDRDDALRHAWRWLEDRGGRTRVVVVPVRRSVTHSPVLLQISTRYQTETMRTFWAGAGNLREGAVVAVWPSKKTLHEVQEHNPAEVLVVPWSTEACDAWLRAHRSSPLLGGTGVGEVTISDPVVLEAMKGLTSLVNLRNNLVTGYDRDMAIAVLRKLVQSRCPVDPEEIYIWAMANGWEGEGAERLKTLASEMLGGKRHRTLEKGPLLRPDIMDYWRERARGESD